MTNEDSIAERVMKKLEFKVKLDCSVNLVQAVMMNRILSNTIATGLELS
jgi:hypothetical protein